MNSQQQNPDPFYPAQSGYAGQTNRSPSLRNGYSTGTVSASMMGASRRAQQPLESIGQQPSPLYSDDRFSSFDPPPRYDRQPQGQATLPAGFGNSSAWAFSNTATLGGPLYDGSRVSRGLPRRAALPAEWANESLSFTTPNNSSQQPFYPPSSQMMGLQNGGGGNDMFTHPGQGMGYQHDMRSAQDNSDVITTAIVIKNIPFNVRKEMLAQHMTDMNLPTPYAFNYHFDQGVFRGLAFANFNNAADTKMVIDAMNGLEISGRKLRVEYKKMLPEHERERIEREKREKRGQLEEQHRGPSHQISVSSLQAAAMQPRPSPERGFRVHVPSMPQASSRPTTDQAIGRAVDMNDPQTLKFYLTLYMFKGDDTKEVYIFPNDTSPRDRQIIHILAHNMCLEHTSIGEGENRQLHVTKAKSMQPPHQPTGHLHQPGVGLDGHPRGLSRAATYDFAERTQHGPIHSGARATLAVPGSPDGQHANALRNIKSFADLRSFTPSPSPSNVSNNHLGPPNPNHGGTSIPYGYHMGSDMLTNPASPANGINNTSAGVDASGLVASLGSLGLGSSSYDHSGMSHGGRSRDTPGAIGSQRPGANGAGGPRANPDRQPRGPEAGWETAGGFASRARTNGHVTRGSDSSDNTGRLHGPPGTMY